MRATTPARSDALAASPLEHKAVVGAQRYLGRCLRSLPRESISQPRGVLMSRVLQPEALNIERRHHQTLELPEDASTVTKYISTRWLRNSSYPAIPS